jgi:hypothetical protein
MVGHAKRTPKDNKMLCFNVFINAGTSRYYRKLLNGNHSNMAMATGITQAQSKTAV